MRERTTVSTNRQNSPKRTETYRTPQNGNELKKPVSKWCLGRTESTHPGPPPRGQRGGGPGVPVRFPPPEASTASGGAKHGPGAIITELTRRPGARRWSNHPAPVRLAAAAPTHGGYRTSVLLPAKGPPHIPALYPGWRTSRELGPPHFRGGAPQKHGGLTSRFCMRIVLS